MLRREKKVKEEEEREGKGKKREKVKREVFVYLGGRLEKEEKMSFFL